MSVRKEFSEALARSLERRLEREDALLLASARGEELLALLRAALAAKTEASGYRVTFSKNVFVPLTTLCMNKCSYCGFRREPGEPGAGYIDPRRAVELVVEAEKRGAKEVLVSGGDRPEARYEEARRWLRRMGYESTVEYAADLEERILSATKTMLPHTNIGVLSKKELSELKPLNASMGLMLESISERLLEPGMPHHESPTKNPKVRLRVLEDAGSLGIPFTTGILVGIGETWEERIDSLLAIRRIHERYGHIQEVIIQGFMPEPGTPMEKAPPPSHEELLKTTAIARLVFKGSLAVQVPPNLLGKARSLYLLAGADDWGGVSSLTPDYVNPAYPWPSIDELRRDTESAGFKLRERLPAYPRYVLGGWLPPRLAERAEQLVGDDGLVES